MTITFVATCEIGAAEPVHPTLDEAGAHVFLEMTSSEPIRGVGPRRFEGGCVTTYASPPGSPSALVREADDALSHVSRSQIVHHVDVDDGGILCGDDAPAGEDG